MPKHPLLYVWILILGALFASGYIRPASDMQSVAQRNDETNQAKTNQRSAEPAKSPAGQQEQPKATHYTADCSKPEEHKDADFCQQVRMADAAWRQVRIGWVGLGLVLGTLVATFVAAVAAWRTVKVMKNTGESQLRAYVAGRWTHISSFNSTNYAWAKFDITNVGVTPANAVEHWAIIEVFPYPLPSGFIFPTAVANSGQTTSFPSLPSQGHVTALRSFTPAEIAAITGRTARVYLYGEISYRHGFGLGRTRFAASVNATDEMLARLTSDYLPDDLKVDFIAVDQWNHAY